MRVLSLFSGIGGFDLGLERAGMEIIGQVEIDPYCQKVLAKHWPNVKRMGDIHDVRGDEFGAVDLICGGFPCQPVSLAGKGLGADDQRWLWPEYARLVRSIRPRYVLVENVRGLFNRGFGVVIADLVESGYDTEWDCIRASEIGAHHRRDRMYLLAYPDCVHGKARMGHQQDGQRTVFAGHHPQRVSVGIQAPDCAPRDPHGLPAGVYLNRGRAIGNAVVPQIVEWIGKRIMEAR